MRNWDVSLPTEAEKERSIEVVLDAALPEHKRATQWLRQIMREFPLSHLFFGVEDCVFLAVFLAAACLAPAAFSASQYGPLPALIFLVSPVLYMALHLFTSWKESLTGTMDWKRTCRVSVQEITALRMLVFGGASTVACVVASVVFWQAVAQTVSLFWLLGVSFSSLFLYAALSLACVRVQSRWGYMSVPAAWVVCGTVLMYWDSAAGFLLQVPAYVFALLAFGSLVVFLVEIKHMALSRPIEGGFYALS